MGLRFLFLLELEGSGSGNAADVEAPATQRPAMLIRLKYFMNSKSHFAGKFWGDFNEVSEAACAWWQRERPERVEHRRPRRRVEVHHAERDPFLVVTRGASGRRL